MRLVFEMFSLLLFIWLTNKINKTMKLLTFLYGRRKYKCETCNKRFTRLSHLNVHNRIHSREKPFACDQCQKSFNQMNNLTRHKMLHTGRAI